AWWESQGRIEYPDLFDAEREGAALARIAATLSAGFRADAGAADWAAARRLMRESIADPSRGLRLARRGWEILRSEGVGGLRRR
ncbi:MAG: hypothetical protein JNJ72_20070, partial [Anaerolineales bacterium]|nr:hypothetical protein [Anaerolineales bacterium]